MNNIQPKNPNLVEITSPLQASRGNRQFYDKKHCISYISYSNGYVRREVNAAYISPYNGNKYKMQDQFPINRRKSYMNEWGFKSYKLIKEFNEQNRMDMIDRISTNYKGYKGRFNNKGYVLIPK